MSKVSIIVPIYNVEKYIGKMIESLQKQTLEDIQIILVDDGSSDNSGLVCDRYALNDNRIKVIHKKNAGVSAARNDGLSVAHGEYVIFCDSDDWLPLDAMEKMYEEAKDQVADIVIGDVYLSEKEKNTLVHFYEKAYVTSDKNFIRKLVQADIYRTYCPCPYNGHPAFGYGGPWNKLVRRSLLIQNDITFDVRVNGIFDDIIYTAYILANACTVSYIQKPVYYYRIINNSITHSYKENVLDINKAIFNSWEEFIARYGLDGYYQKPYYAVVIRRFVESLPVYFLSKKNPKSFQSRVCELKNVISESVYQEAVKNVDVNKLTPFQRQICRLMKSKSVKSILFLQKVKLILKAIR